MNEQFPNEHALTVSLLLVCVALLGICLLFVAQWDRSVERTLYYVLFSIMFASAIVYNVLSGKKLWWLIRRRPGPKR